MVGWLPVNAPARDPYFDPQEAEREGGERDGGHRLNMDYAGARAAREQMMRLM